MAVLEAQAEKAALKQECDEAKELAAQVGKQREELEVALAEAQKAPSVPNEQLAELQNKIAELETQNQSLTQALYL